jgi:ribosomal protein L19
LLHRINKHLVRTQGHSEAKHMRLFSKRNPYRALPGSILQVTSYSNAARTSTTSFSGQLIAVKRGGVDTSFRLRALLARTGVEIRYNAASNLIHDIKVIARADKAKGAQRKSGRPALLRARFASSLLLLPSHTSRQTGEVIFPARSTRSAGEPGWPTQGVRGVRAGRGEAQGAGGSRAGCWERAQARCKGVGSSRRLMHWSTLVRLSEQRGKGHGVRSSLVICAEQSKYAYMRASEMRARGIEYETGTL